ncbi:hypothetical protein OHC33_008545 [Knufia fluminis]|uniref:Uncharacterized protein n=1 Tax=Knufia fluminis TaxID=191047 RepID=A0AAN8EMW4_9EURO|nr:hypothetical protein OHC33_008545 [Knufia fluminis]
MKHLSTQVATQVPASKRSTYASFRADPTFNFDNFSVERNIRKTPCTSNFSRPLSIRPTFSADDPDPGAVFILPELSRQSSFTSSWRDSDPSTARSTPSPDTPSVTHFPAAPVVLSSEDNVYTDTARYSLVTRPLKFADRMSFAMPGPSKSPDLDLSFPVEKLWAHRGERPVSSSSHRNYSRPGTANGPKDAQKDPPEDTAKARDTKPVLAPLLLTRDNRFEQPRSAPPTTTSFSDFKQGLSDRQESQGLTSLKSGPPSPALLFLQKDPYSCPLHGDKRQRPKSAGVGASPLSQETDVAGGIDFDAPVKGQGAPSIKSTKSTRSIKSIKRGLSRFKNVMKGPLRNED